MTCILTTPPATSRSLHVLVDHRERAAYTFTDITLGAPVVFFPDGSVGQGEGDAQHLRISTERVQLATGDYSLPGFTHLVAVERKSLQDLHATIGDRGRRQAFEDELERMHMMAVDYVDPSMMGPVVVVVENNWQTTDLPQAKGPGLRHALCNVVNVLRRLYPRVRWESADGRRAAEIGVALFLMHWAERLGGRSA